MRFPKSEAEVVKLAREIIAGISESSDFPDPPFSSTELQNMLNSFNALSETQVASQASTQQTTDEKQAGFDEMISMMKSILRYAENTVHGNDTKLSQLGWGGKSPQTPLAMPGQPRLLTAPRQGEGWLRLEWKQPVEGGEVAFYKIELRERAEGDWVLTGNAIETEVALSGQEQGKKLEYRVIAVNRTGEGEPSNTVAAVL